MIIRQMKKEDATEVEQIEKECFYQTWSTQGFIDALDHSAFFLVAEEAKQILGYVGMYVTVPEGEITNVAVKPEYRDRKIGSALVEQMQQWSLEHGVNRIVLEVRSGNMPAICLYEHKGFVKLGVRKNFYQFPKEDADIMEWNG